MRIKPFDHKRENRPKRNDDIHPRTGESLEIGVKPEPLNDPRSNRASSIFAGFESTTMKAALTLGMMFADDGDIPVLIEGESGTGKSRLARLIHDMSPRSAGPFVRINAAAIPEGLVASELFGHVVGAFTGAVAKHRGKFVLASGGTLCIDELGKAPPQVQLNLLSCIEEQVISVVGDERETPVNVRIIGVTNVTLEKLVAAGTFLPDLAARLCTFRVTLPPLRERAIDIPTLARHYVGQHRDRLWPSRPIPTIRQDLMGALCRAQWQNNLRQLDDELRLALMYSQYGPELSLDHCEGILTYLRELRDVRKPVTVAEFNALIVEFESKRAAAFACGIDRKTFDRRHRLAQARESA